MPSALDFLSPVGDICDGLAEAGSNMIDTQARALAPARRDHWQCNDATLNAKLTDGLLRFPSGKIFRVGNPAVNYDTTGSKRLLVVGAGDVPAHLDFATAGGTAGATIMMGVAAPGAILKAISGHAASLSFETDPSHFVTKMRVTVEGWVAEPTLVDEAQLAQVLGSSWLPMEEDVSATDPSLKAGPVVRSDVLYSHRGHSPNCSPSSHRPSKKKIR